MKGLPLVYEPDDDPEVNDHTAEAAAQQSHNPICDVDDDPAFSSEDESDMEINAEENLQVKQTKKTGKSINVIQKLHEPIVHILKSEKRRAKMNALIRTHCIVKYRHLVLVRSMPIRWNTVYAEIDRSLKLKPAINTWIQNLDTGLSPTSKAGRAALKKKIRWELTHSDWKALEFLMNILKIFNDITLDLSKSGSPTITKVLSLYKYSETQLVGYITELERDGDDYHFIPALQAGLEKQRKYIALALRSKYTILGTVLHPYTRMSAFRNRSLWSTEIELNASGLMEDEYDLYEAKFRNNTPDSGSTEPAMSIPTSIFAKAISRPIGSPRNDKSELDRYYDLNIYPCTDPDTALDWWKTHSHHFPILSCIARDILAVPGVSVSVERLFSSSKHTLTDSRSSLSALTASKTICAKEWLKKGLDEGVEFLTGNEHLD